MQPQRYKTIITLFSALIFANASPRAITPAAMVPAFRSSRITNADLSAGILQGSAILKTCWDRHVKVFGSTAPGLVFSPTAKVTAISEVTSNFTFVPRGYGSPIIIGESPVLKTIPRSSLFTHPNFAAGGAACSKASNSSKAFMCFLRPRGAEFYHG
jgi:hypothetical protein